MKFAHVSEYLELFLKHGVPVDYADKSGRTALHCAAGRGALPSVKLLLARGADQSVTDHAETTPLGAAATATHEGCPEVVSALLTAGSEVNPDPKSARHPLVIVASCSLEGEENRNRSLAVAQLLIEAGANNTGRLNGQHALYLAAKDKNITLCELLIEKGGFSPFSLCDRDGEEPESTWDLVTREGPQDLRDAILGCGGLDLGTVLESTGQTALFMAVAAEDKKLVKKLLRAGAPPDVPDSKGKTPLVRAANVKKSHTTDYDEIAELLLDYGADPDLVVNEASPLFWAVRRGNRWIIKMLLRFGARYEPTNEKETKILADAGALVSDVVTGWSAEKHAAAKEWAPAHVKTVKLAAVEGVEDPKGVYYVDFDSRLASEYASDSDESY